MGDVIQFSKFRVNWVAIVKTTTTTTKMNREFNYNLDFFFFIEETYKFTNTFRRK